jgi:hypothetical protein
MTEEQFKELGVGDVVKSAVRHCVYVVTANYGDRVTAVMTADMTNPDEWLLVRKANRSHRRKVESDPWSKIVHHIEKEDSVCEEMRLNDLVFGSSSTNDKFYKEGDK